MSALALRLVVLDFPGGSPAHSDAAALLHVHLHLLLAVQARKVQGVFVDAVLLGFIQPATLRRPDLPLPMCYNFLNLIPVVHENGKHTVFDRE